jgi:XTP/dITP diphosphohydrolase
MRQILIATTNKGKFAELSAMLDADVGWLSLKNFPDIPEVKEDGRTFAENARKKALGYAKATGLWTIADDSGLMIDALGEAPGINSARFSGEKLPDEDRSLIDHRNIAKVLELLKDVPKEKRAARFVCSLCLASPEKILAETEGVWEGIIADKEYGAGGFGYDPIMYIPGLKKTAGQLTASQKNKRSHRFLAARRLKPLLQQLVASEGLQFKAPA